MTGVSIMRLAADEVLLFDPDTGEQIDLAVPPGELALMVTTLAKLRERIRDAEEDQRIAKAALDAALHAVMDFESTLTLRADGYEITGKSATTFEWDVNALEAALKGLVDEGDLSDDAARRALKPVITLKPMAGDLKKLAARFPVVEGCRAEVPQARRATVKRGAA